MAQIFINQSIESIACQIGAMINTYNNLSAHQSYSDIMGSAANYFIEIYGEKVVGCAAYEKKYNGIIIKHLCILPEERNKGIAKKLITTIMKNNRNQFVYCFIKENNLPSQWLFKSMGFNLIKTTQINNSNFLMVGRTSE